MATRPTRPLEMEDMQGRFDRLREAANESARSFRTAYAFYLIVALYILVIVSSTHHELLFRAGGVQMPIVNVGVPVVWFFTVVPWLLVLLHFNLLIQAMFLADKVSQYATALKGQIRSRTKRSEALGLLYPAPLAHKVADAAQQGSMRKILNVIVFFTLAVLPPAILIFAQVRFLPYQNELFTWLHRAAVVIDIGLLWWLWPRIAAPHVKWRIWLGTQELKALVAMARRIWLGTQELRFLVTMAWRVWHRTWGLAVVGMTVFVGLFSVVIADFPGGAIGNLTSFLDPGRDYLLGREYGLSNRVLVHKEPSPEILAAHYRATCESEKGCDESVTAIGSTFWCKHAKPLQLTKNRNFRNAALSGSTLCQADLRETKFHEAVLEAAKLHGTDLREAELHETNLRGAELHETDLRGAELHKTDLQKAKLHGATLWETELHGAYLQEAELYGTALWGTGLISLLMQGAELHGAYLQEAKLHGTNLGRAKFYGADLRGAELHEASLWGTDFYLTDLRGINLSLEEEELEEVKREIKEISSPELQKKVLRSIENSKISMTFPYLPYLKDSILCEGENLHTRLKNLNFLDENENFVLNCRPQDEDQLRTYYKRLNAYYEKLSDYLVDLVCSDESGYVAEGIARRSDANEEYTLPSWKKVLSVVKKKSENILEESDCKTGEESDWRL